MQPHSHDFEARAAKALGDANLQRALSGLKGGLVAQRAAARAALPEFEALRETAKSIRDHTLAHLDHYLAAFEARAAAAGSHVHYAATAEEARDVILRLCLAVNARLVTKGKSMVSEEIGLNDHLERQGLEVVETDLGEYLLQIRGETPSHIVAPAIHITEEEVAADFRRHHTHLDPGRPLADPQTMVAEARAVLRRKFLAADVGITGANFLIAETGTSVIVTNEGNGDLTQSLPKVHVVLASIDKIVPTLEDTAVLLRVLARSGTGQEMTAYTTFSTGPRRPSDVDGPEACHIVILDNGRTEMLAGPMREALRCIRCGACLNHCPVYTAVGGHAYGWVYSGPIGAVVTPALAGLGEGRHLPNASSFCGRCEEVCPVKIPLVSLMRGWREADTGRGGLPWRQRLGLAIWAYFAKRPRLYHVSARLGMGALARLAGSRRVFTALPLASAWTRHRDFPVPEGETFQARWRRRAAGPHP